MILSFTNRRTASRVLCRHDLLHLGFPRSDRSIHSASKTLKQPARTRFAPSPTGNLHLGSVRTALFNYLIAKKSGGQFLLRIEDTDQKRTIAGAEERLFDDLQWAGIFWDEGPVVGGPCGPYRQSERTSVYRDHSDQLIQSGAAYRCFCSAQRLDTLARSRNDKGLTPGYDRKCFDISSEESDQRAHDGESYVVRLRAPDQYPHFVDLVYGKTGKGAKSKKDLYLDNAAYEDPILMKSDGYPTYHFANVVDDHLMKITHVIRGSEWMASTPLHMAIYEAFGWNAPYFAHVALLVDANGQKLSKRDKASDMSFYRSQEGVFSDALVNFAALLGWSHTRKSDVMRLKELEEEFSLKFTKGNATVSFEKLWFLQQRHALRYINEGGPQYQRMVDELLAIAKEKYPTSPLLQAESSKETLSLLLRADGKNYSTPVSFLTRNSNFFLPMATNLPPYTQLNPSIPLSVLRTTATALTFVPPEQWISGTHSANINALTNVSTSPSSSSSSSTSTPALEHDQKSFRKELFHYLRWLLLAGAHGPGIPDTMTVLGRGESVRRILRGVKQTMAHEQAQEQGRGTADKASREGIKIQKFLEYDGDEVKA